MRRRAPRAIFDEIEHEIKDSILLCALKITTLYPANFVKSSKYGLDEIICAIFKSAGVPVDALDLDEPKDRAKFFEEVKIAYQKALNDGMQICYPPILEHNIQKLSDAIKLSRVEALVLKFTVLLSFYEELRTVTDIAGADLSTTQAIKLISVLLDEDVEEIKIALNRESRLATSGLLRVEAYNKSLYNKIEVLSSGFVERMMSEHKNIYAVIKGILTATDAGTLDVGDYGHVQKNISVLLPLLKSSTEAPKGSNILIYGSPGTGKTELAKAISKAVGAKLYEVDYQDSALKALDADDRLRAFRLAQVIFENQSGVMLMFDEAEDVFRDEDRGGYANKTTQRDKAFVNRLLENANIPTIWLTNSVRMMDEAVLRRFDMVFELPIPPKKKRYQIIQDEAKELLDEKSINELSKYERLSPAVIAKTLRVVNSIRGDIDEPSAAAKMMIEDMLKAQGHDKQEQKSASKLPSFYDPSLVNTDIDLSELARGIEGAKSARICLYGAPGTGKSAYGRWLSEYLEKPLILKKGSDLLSKWVGGTEKNIKSAFEEAFDESGILLFDEVDSFLMDRNSAQNNWEITQVNELLTQMESFGGIFLATTNLMDNLDEASLRRFDAKVEFGYLKKEQALSLYLSCLKELGLRVSAGAKDAVKVLSYLTPGDFATVMRRSRFNKIKNADEFVAKLKEEVDIKKDAKGSKMGFLAS